MRSQPRLYLLAAALFLMAACAQNPTPQPQQDPGETVTPTPTPRPDDPPSPTATPTPTPVPQALDTPTPQPTSPCAGLSGYLEVQILVGPSDAVGLEPVAVGELPFTVAGNSSPYPLSGATTLSYQDTLVEEWGSFDVQFDAAMTVDGSCSDADQRASLEMVVTTEGEQFVTVTSEGFSGEYPWAGTHAHEFVLPAENGATSQGEGWAFVLYVD